MTQENLIFIVSQPRSGSTLLQNLLSNNNQVNTVSEPWIMLKLAPFFKPNLIKATYDYNLTTLAAKDYETKYNDLAIDDKVKNLALNYYKPMLQGFEYVIDKTPRYWEILDELVTMFPHSKIIILKRNPIDVANSIIKTWNISTLEELNYYRRDLLVAPKVMLEFCERHRSNPNVMAVRYEDLVSDMDREVQNLYHWLGIEFTPKVLDTKKNKKYKGLYGDPYQNNTKKIDAPLSKSFVDFLDGYQHYLGSDFLKKFGNYEGSGGSKTRPFKYFLSLDASIIKPLNIRSRLRRELVLAIKRMLVRYK